MPTAATTSSWRDSTAAPVCPPQEYRVLEAETETETETETPLVHGFGLGL